MKKAVAIPYVIALVLGVAVVGLLGYWFVSQSGKTVKEASSAECQARTFNFCLNWQNNDKTCGTGKPTEPIVGCPIPDKNKCMEIGFCK